MRAFQTRSEIIAAAKGLEEQSNGVLDVGRALEVLAKQMRFRNWHECSAHFKQREIHRPTPPLWFRETEDLRQLYRAVIHDHKPGLYVPDQRRVLYYSHEDQRPEATHVCVESLGSDNAWADGTPTGYQHTITLHREGGDEAVTLHWSIAERPDPDAQVVRGLLQRHLTAAGALLEPGTVHQREAARILRERGFKPAPATGGAPARWERTAGTLRITVRAAGGASLRIASDAEVEGEFTYFDAVGAAPDAQALDRFRRTWPFAQVVEVIDATLRVHV